MDSATTTNGAVNGAARRTKPRTNRPAQREVADMLTPRFGEQVVSAYLGGRLLHATGPRTWALFAVLFSMLASALALLTFGRVEMVAVGRGCIGPEIGPTIEVVSFVSEADRASIVPGLSARVELEQFAGGELGTVGARVLRVSSTRVRASELSELLGDDVVIKGAVYRVDLTLTDDEHLASVRKYLHPGMLVNARYTLRTQRPITLVLQPLQRWLD